MRRLPELLALAILASGGAGLLLAAVTTMPPRPPQPAGGAWAAGVRKPAPGTLARSEPVAIAIPQIALTAPVVATGVERDGSVSVPPLGMPSVTGWYRLGPSPGEAGGAVIVGHVDSRKSGPAVFFNLGALKRGATIEVTRRDRTVVVFMVDGVRSYPKRGFPVDEVYGPLDRPTLRLITCGGKFDVKKHSYQDNVIVFASFSSWRR
ncbi:MAG TPA: class F sortase [Micromonosporaceae bacterium]|jgi:hypothetical protein|nr:class F sortase [Micromonosporaceae bacterium]